MPNSSYVLTVTVNTSAGAAQASASVTVTNNTNSETLTEDTDSTGIAIFNLANLTTQWLSTDIISIHAVYGGSDATEQFYPTGGSASETLTLATSTSTAALRYFETSDFYTTFGLSNYTDDSTNGIRESRITEIGAGVETEIDNMLNTKFDSTNTITDEYHDTDEWQDTWFLKNVPIQTLTSFSVNKALPDEEEDWDDIADTDTYETYDLDIDYNTGRVKVTDSYNLPEPGHNQVKATYTYGRSSVPSDIKWLAMLMTARGLGGSTLMRISASGIENSGLNSLTGNISNLDKQIQDIIESRRIGRIGNV